MFTSLGHGAISGGYEKVWGGDVRGRVEKVGKIQVNEPGRT